MEKKKSTQNNTNNGNAQEIPESKTKSNSLLWSLREKFAKKKSEDVSSAEKIEDTSNQQSEAVEENALTSESGQTEPAQVESGQTESVQTESDEGEISPIESGEGEQAEPPPPPPPPPPPKIDLKVSSDNMVVYIRVHLNSEEQKISTEDILSKLEDAGIKYGICNEDIVKYCEDQSFFSELVAARGLRPIDGVDGSIEYHFKTEEGINLLEKEDGTVNYRELGLIQNVEAGQPLATAIPPVDGENGITVFGVTVPFKPGKAPDLHTGENAEISPDGTQILAKVDGCVELKNSQVVVNDVYVVKGDVNIGVGNLDCKGSIVVQGDVHEGFVLKANNDITIKGSVEGATIVCGGKVTISNGMNGMGIGSITAGGDVISKYIENTRITTNSDIYADVIMHSKVKADGSVILKGSKASIIGGICDVGKSVIAGFVGSHTNAVTMISIQSPRIDELLSPNNDKTEQIGTLMQEISDLSAQEEKFQEDIQRLSKEMMTDPQAKVALKRAMNEKNHIAGTIAKFKEELEELKSSASQIGEFKVVASKICYTGTKINIGYVYFNVEDDYNNSKFYIDGHSIVSGPLLPSDRQ